MSPLRILACDDEPLALERLTDMLARLPDVMLAGSAENGRDTLSLIAAARPDVLLLDIEMPRLDGFDVVEELAAQLRGVGSPPPLIIFVTAYPRFAAQAFDSGALDFLTKPVRFARLEQAVARARRALDDREAHRRLDELARQLDALRAERAGEGPESRHLWVQRRGELVRVDLDKIDWIRAEGEYVRLFCGETSYLHRDLISAIIERLDERRFVRVHRSVIVNRERVASIKRARHGAIKLVLDSGEELPVGRTYRRDARTMTAG